MRLYSVIFYSSLLRVSSVPGQHQATVYLVNATGAEIQYYFMSFFYFFLPMFYSLHTFTVLPPFSFKTANKDILLVTWFRTWRCHMHSS